MAAGHCEDVAVLIAIDGNAAWERRGVNGQVLVQRQLAAGQSDGLAAETACKLDRGPGKRGGNGVAEGAGTGIRGVGDQQHKGDPSWIVDQDAG